MTNRSARDTSWVATSPFPLLRRRLFALGLLNDANNHSATDTRFVALLSSKSRIAAFDYRDPRAQRSVRVTFRIAVALLSDLRVRLR